MARPSALPNAPTLPLSYAYASNQANQRTRMGLADGSYWVYQYDQLGPVISGRRFWTDGTPVAGQQFEYGFDDIGNRTSTGDPESAESTYRVNFLNQYGDRTVAGDIDVFGIANPTDDVTVNSVDADRHGEFFHRTVPVTNTSTAQYSAITVVSEYGATQTSTGGVFVAKSPEVFTHDDDGNLTQDGRWDYVWDGENRLAKMRSLSGSPAPERRIEFEYDWQGRRIRKQVFNDRDDGQGTELSDTVFLYDGWNLIGELNANSSNAKIRTYVWGNDLSGSMQGAGGVGGLLKAVNHGDSTQHFVAYDGNGNVMGLVDDSDGTISARYEHGLFAEPLRASGAQAANPFRFSTEYCDAESRLYYYGYRYYNPSTGRWPNRDPIAEVGGINLYGFVHNDGLNLVDITGDIGWGPGAGAGQCTPAGQCPREWVTTRLPPPSPPPLSIPRSELTCCNSKRIALGEKMLNMQLANAVAAAQSLGLKPGLGSIGTPGATCKNSSRDFIDWLMPFPACWRCMLDLQQA